VNTSVTDIDTILCELRAKLSSVEHVVSVQGTEIARLNRVISRKDKEIAALKRENKVLKERLSKYEKPPKDSHNSSIPPSQEPICSKEIRRTNSLRKKSDRPVGGQKGHVGFTLDTAVVPDVIKEHQPHFCECCGESLDKVPSICTRTSQVVDIPPIQPIITEHRAYRKQCVCGHVSESKLPKECSKRISYGAGIKTLIGYLNTVQCIPYARLKECLKDLFGLSLSQGTIRNVLQKSMNAGKGIYEEIRSRITNESSVGADETGANVNGKHHWYWAFQSNSLTYLFHHHSRGRKAIEAHRLECLPKAILTTDRHSSYFGMEVRGHQLCLAHILRELIYLEELDKGQTWAARMAALFREAIHAVKTTALNKLPIKALSKRLDELLDESTAHLHENFDHLRKSLLKYRDYIFIFLTNPEVPYDNNASYPNFIIIQTFHVGSFNSAT
jgi:transposase/uncharacterized coiled-coil protein SlyX